MLLLEVMSIIKANPKVKGAVVGKQTLVVEKLMQKIVFTLFPQMNY